MNRIKASYHGKRATTLHIRNDAPERYVFIGERARRDFAVVTALRRRRPLVRAHRPEQSQPLAKRFLKALFADGWIVVVFLGGLLLVGLIAAFVPVH